MAFMFNLNLHRLTVKQLWDYYELVMNRYIKTPATNPQRKVFKLIADATLDEYFHRIEKKLTVPNE